MIMKCARHLAMSGVKDKLEIIFDEQDSFGPEARKWYPLIRDVGKTQSPEVYASMPVEPIFRSDTELLPLQAADLFAWCIRRGGESRLNHPFLWVFEHIQEVRWSLMSEFYDLERLTALRMEAGYALLSGQVSDELIEKYRHLKDRK